MGCQHLEFTLGTSDLIRVLGRDCWRRHTCFLKNQANYKVREFGTFIRSLVPTYIGCTQAALSSPSISAAIDSLGCASSLTHRTLSSAPKRASCPSDTTLRLFGSTRGYVSWLYRLHCKVIDLSGSQAVSHGCSDNRCHMPATPQPNR